MKTWIQRAFDTYFGPAIDLRVRIFNVLALAGCICALAVGVVNAFSGSGPLIVAIDLAASLLSAGLFYYAYKTRRYKDCYLVTIVVIFMLLFPYLFLKMGGYHGGIPMFLIFAIVFTVFLLESKTAFIVTGLELALYAGLFVFAYKNPAAVTAFPAERGFLVSNLMDMLVVGVALGATMYAQVRLYREQQRRVDEQNAVLEQTNLAKTRFLANASHEMRTPLTVVSVNIQTVMRLLKRMDSLTDDGEAQELLRSAQAEIMRLSRMVGGMLSLNAIAEGGEKKKTDLSALLRDTAEMLRLLLEKENNRLETDVAANLTVFGSADLLSQVVVNLLQNANTHTKNGIISLRASASGGVIIVTVADNGTGIRKELLPRVFERGVSEGGAGVGLFLCKTVAESHGGTIDIESEEGSGTAVTFTLPVYQGQFEGA